MCHRHGGGHSVSSLCFATLTQADVHPWVGRRLVGVVVVGEELLAELALVVVVQLGGGEGGRRQRQNNGFWDLFPRGDFKYSVLFIVIIIVQLLYFFDRGLLYGGCSSPTLCERVNGVSAAGPGTSGE